MTTDAIRAQAHLHHALFLGLQLKASSSLDSAVIGDWMFRLFRRQHTDKFLSSFAKLGLTDDPHAVACAKYHVLSNNIGGVGVEYMFESPQKAWVRFRYPRWMYAGPTLCGVPVEVSRGFLRGWYAHNGVSLGNPRLGFVCVSEDMTGDFGFCGYFQEYDHELSEAERLRFAPGELPPPFDPAAQPEPPPTEWNEERLAKANRNYALEYVRNGLAELLAIIGPDETKRIGGVAARLIGLQYFPAIAEMVGAKDGDHADAAAFLADMLRGMGDEVETRGSMLVQTTQRVLRGLSGAERGVVQHIWHELWRGTMRSQGIMKDLELSVEGDALVWRVVPLSATTLTS